MARRLLVTGATGKQGGALISALTSTPTSTFEIYALTRSKTSASAQKLQAKPGVTVIEGNLDNVDDIFKQITKPLWGVFVVPINEKGAEKEEKQTKEVVDASIKAGISHLVITTTDRGGQIRSEDLATTVPHFASKFHVEQHIKQEASKPGNHFTYTFLRPVAFFENINPDFFGKVFVSWWRALGAEQKIQLISTVDIGKVAAKAFLLPDSARYKNQGISLAGDDISLAEVEKIFREEVNQQLPSTFWIVASAIRVMVKDIRMMLAWFVSDGFGADVSAVKKEYPFMADFRTWLRTESAWKKQ